MGKNSGVNSFTTKAHSLVVFCPFNNIDYGLFTRLVQKYISHKINRRQQNMGWGA